MISNNKYSATKEVLSELVSRQGGSLFFSNRSASKGLSGTVFERDQIDNRIAVKVPYDHKEFSISIYSTDYNAETYTDNAIEIVKLVLFVNPRDLVIGQQQIVSNTYTRRGWINAAWGNQQATLSVSGVSPGFYFYYKNKSGVSKGGITNKYRRGSPGFINIIDVMGLFRNNGWNFLDGVKNPSLFKDGTSRVINVMDSIKIEYDGSTYIGSFSTFTLNDVAASPYKMEYSFEFIVSSFGLDLQGVDGHISKNGNHKNKDVNVAIQGANMNFRTILGLDTDELNRYFPIEEVPDPSLYDYSEDERKNEVEFFGREGEKGVITIPEGVFRITRGWRDGEKHDGKCDFRTHTGTIYSATEGSVVDVKVSPYYGGLNYIIVKSTWAGSDVYVRYFHIAYGSHKVRIGETVHIGTVMGQEGGDNGKYPKHCDFEVRKISGLNANYFSGPRIEATPVLDNMWKVLSAKAGTDGTFEKDFKKLIAKHSSPGVVNEHEVKVT